MASARTELCPYRVQTNAACQVNWMRLGSYESVLSFCARGLWKAADFRFFYARARYKPTAMRLLCAAGLCFSVAPHIYVAPT